jgi:hypothetical protein
MSVKAYYDAEVRDFLNEDDDRILGILTAGHHHSLEGQQRWAWQEQLKVLKQSLHNLQDGHLFLEFYIPRMGKRADALLITGGIVFVVEFKIGAWQHSQSALDQVEDYALDLKNFHEGTHPLPVVPILISSKAPSRELLPPTFADDRVAEPVATNASQFEVVIADIVTTCSFASIDITAWMATGYKPTPTIVEAAQTLYRTHSVIDISRSDAGAKNLQETSASVSAVIDHARQFGTKAICFVTGVPGSGKTLAGLNIATRRSEEHRDENAVFLSGNGPLVDVLREALTRDTADREGISKNDARRKVRSFVQNIHHFRDQYVGNNEIPAEKVVIFDEAQRAWTRQQAASFMQRKRGQAQFDMSEPEFLISVMDRHADWCTVVCLIGGGQEINTGEAGISEWITALETRFSHWAVHVSPRISLPDYGASIDTSAFMASPRVQADEHLHLAVSMRSFRAEALSDLIGHLVDNEANQARSAFARISKAYPIVVTRDLQKAKKWLRSHARGTERFGLVASSGAQRLRPAGIHIKAAIEPSNWFLNDAKDVRSSYYLEEVASEFDVQGLELDWAGVCWDGDFHHDGHRWISQAFKGSKWQSVNDASRRMYLKNAYRVILTRARQGMVVFVPAGDKGDWTRPAAYYDGTYRFLACCGIESID